MAKKRAFTWEAAETGNFLLKIAYIGTDFLGLAYQPLIKDGSNDNNEQLPAKRPRKLTDAEPSQLAGLPTVEGCLLNAMMKANLIRGRDDCGFSRCGRTDKGVHARGNYISVWLRLKPNRSSNDDHYDYTKILNAILPGTVRVISCTKVPSTFDARFNCTYRIYRYYFARSPEVDEEKMANAAKRFLGLHDFTNFCKIDHGGSSNFVRQVVTCDLVTTEGNPIAYFVVVGTAFLWHQIRCMMGVLLKIGAGQWRAEAIDELLDVEKTTTKPAYVMAPANGLILWDCYFEGLSIEPAHSGSTQAFRDLIKGLQLQIEVLHCLSSQGPPQAPALGYLNSWVP